MRFFPDDLDVSYRTMVEKPPVVVSVDSLDDDQHEKFALEISEFSVEKTGPGEQFLCGMIHFTEPYEMVAAIPFTSPIKVSKKRKLGVGRLIELLNGPLANIKKLYG